MTTTSFATAAPFQPIARSARAGDSHPFLPTGETVWQVQAGYIDLFAVQMSPSNEPVGGVAHLVRIGAGECFMGLGADHERRGFAVRAIAAGGTQLAEASRAALTAFAS